MKTKIKDFKFEIKSINEKGEFSGYASVFGVKDSYGDVVVSGAFLESLSKWAKKGRFPPILYQHDPNLPIGKFTDMKEDEHGLYVEGLLLIDDIDEAKKAHALLKNNVIDGLSIGYATNKAKWDDKANTLNLLSIDLWEVSIVTFPANEDATVNDIKSKLQTGELPSLSEFEKFLRESGFSKSQALVIASKGLRQLIQGEPEHDYSDEIKQSLKILRGRN